jgi:hypothetical protein
MFQIFLYFPLSNIISANISTKLSLEAQKDAEKLPRITQVSLI